ncbi:N-acetyl-gamma-glutamyl-phosphate reductase [Saccharopolyspora phatthalungensis]|uniref:N-acetyl-gamma-glutamyl-phosphate reductase n=1 Tax=Saccharopolyspora phatthalungensis TaxID=664693 RepID=A0A840QAD8_9PSEU|nr:N-acetyl-gamma-glutamyl-phosphate reductase [Saccharopolyspora phatthalungensis]MBB5159502.1 N-acetyl-gamma-glutamyl-phosphate reductase common form [Saccharopolyspora phatthalungensis]
MSRHDLKALRVGVVGGTGYTGGELCRLLLGHPAVGTILPTARGAGSFATTHPNLLGSGLEFVTVDELTEQAGELDVVFFCTPSGQAMRAAGRFLELGAHVVDLSADFRFPSPDDYEAVYGKRHASPELLAEAVYGVTELNRERIRKSRLVANPGCYAITAILGLAPLLAHGFVDAGAPLSIHAVNGTSGAGVTPKKALMHAEVSNAMLAYSLEGHRHGPELETFFRALTGEPVEVDFNTSHGNFARGIHLQANLRLTREHGRDELLGLYHDFYGAGHQKEHFVLVVDLPKLGELNEKRYEIYPNLRGVVGSNFCHIGLDHDARRGITKIVAVTDNLIKGAAGSAIQNMNVALGLDETLGLRSYAL